ncbi:hypothetical protein Q3G72_025506 [Acer saccharum]|nr:hypothetical protein Q3G72_025506 [Acer saccharum]
MGPARQCQVCNEAQSKYKCPSCLSPYCSLLCFKKHKETPCAKPQEKEKSIVPELPVGKPLAADEPSEVLQKVQLESIASSSEIRDALKDESLQKLILEIDGSPDAKNVSIVIPT